MIFAHLPSNTAYSIPFSLGKWGQKYLVVIGHENRVAVWERAYCYEGVVRIDGYQEVIEINESNISLLPLFWQEYTWKWWHKWGIYEHRKHECAH